MHLTPRGNAVVADELLLPVANAISNLTGAHPESINEIGGKDHETLNNEVTIKFIPNR